MLSLVDERQRRLVLDSLGLGVIGALAAQLFIFLLDIAQEIFLKGIAGYKAPGLPSEGGTLVEVVGSHGLSGWHLVRMPRLCTKRLSCSTWAS